MRCRSIIADCRGKHDDKLIPIIEKNTKKKKKMILQFVFLVQVQHYNIQKIEYYFDGFEPFLAFICL